jgi:hypothetical protein
MLNTNAPGSGARIESHFDDIESLLDEESRTVTADTVEDLSDLDALLEESTALVSARKAQRQGRKLTAEQQDLLEANRLAAEVNSWSGVAVYAHITKTSCQCGHHFEDFQGWYHLEHQRRGGGRRLIRKDCPEGLPASKYVTEVVVPYCYACAPQGLPVASLDDCDLLSALGEPELVNEGQGELAFDEPELEAEVVGDELLEELEEELGDETV